MFELCLKVKVKSLSHVQHFATPWTVAYQAPLSMGFSRQEYWSGLPFPSPGDLPDSGTESRSPVLQADSLPSEPLGKPPEVSIVHICSGEVNRAKLEDEISLFCTKLFPGLTSEVLCDGNWLFCCWASRLYVSRTSSLPTLAHSQSWG